MPEETAPTIYLLYGDDELAIDEFISKMRQMVGDPTTADMNTTHLSLPSLDMAELENAALAMPFLSKRRLVIIHHGARLPKDVTFRDKFFDTLEKIPPSTALVIIESTESYQSRRKNYEKSSPLYAWAQENADRCYMRSFAAPRGGAFPGWIRSRCQEHGGQIKPAAAHLLAEWVSDDQHLADKEILKLLDYVDRRRPIEVQDVELLTPFRGQEDIFAMVDAIGQRNGREALARLHRLLENEDARYAFAMTIRQFRLILQAREATDTGLSPQEALGTSAFVANKAANQARNFSLQDLEKIYRHLLEIDVASKTGGMDLEVALDTLVASLAGP
jgi:DNA polymerase-3 subunit delta